MFTSKEAVNIENQEYFKNPPKKYRGKPFWIWNGKLKKDELLRQISILEEMGMGGYFCHSRTGLVTEYLGSEWMELIGACADKGEKLGMETWLYDEDRWPSGTAGGAVTASTEYRMRFIRMCITDAKAFAWSDKLISAFSVELDGLSLLSKKRLDFGECPQSGTVLSFFEELMETESFYNGSTYLDTMNPKSAEAFLESTHGRYFESLGDRFGNTIKGIFTDEPHRGTVMFDFGVKNNQPEFLAPYTGKLFEAFKERFGYDLIDFLPELFLLNDLPVSHVKWNYMELTQQLFIDNFMKPVNEWCEKHNLLLTGHVLHEDNLASQVFAQGSVMRSYEHMSYPGIDILGEHNYNFWAAKQLQSAARQLGKKTLLSELYGCTGWKLDFEAHKAVGDWQAFFGINLRCHHLCWYTMEGEAKRDYPASIFYQSAWYKEYHYIEDYFSRIHVFMEKGDPLCDILVINPVESLWAKIRPGWFYDWALADEDAKNVEAHYQTLFKTLCGAKLDFDYGDEDFLSRMGKTVVKDGHTMFEVGNRAYRFIVIGKMLTMRGSTLSCLKDFSEAGGQIIFTEEAPQYIDALPNSAASDLKAVYTKLDKLPFAVDNSLVTICDMSGQNIECIYAQVNVLDDGHRIFFLNTDREKGFKNVTINTGLSGFAERWDPRTGEISFLGNGKNLSLCVDFEPGQELLVQISLRDNGYKKLSETKGIPVNFSAPDSYSYKLSEPNVCLLNFSDCIINNESFLQHTEILKIDSLLRSHLGISQRDSSMIQPWFNEKTVHPELCDLTLTYRFRIDQPNCGDIMLAMEASENFIVMVNGNKDALTVSEFYWVDPCFKVFKIHDEILKAGENEITLSCKFREDINLEAIYLLGGFGVSLCGTAPSLKKAPDRLKAGDITVQGFPFYGAGISYYLPVPAHDNTLYMSFDDFEAACVKVIYDKTEQIIAARPYTAKLSQGGGMAEVQYILTRHNTFGPLHMPKIPKTFGPETYTGDEKIKLNYDKYLLYPQGMISQICFME